MINNVPESDKEELTNLKESEIELKDTEQGDSDLSTVFEDPYAVK